MSAEFLGTDFQAGLLKAGATDFGLIQQMMKKGRLGFLLRVLLEEQQLESVANYLFENTSTIGLRYYPVARKELPRSIVEVQSSLGQLRVKESITPQQTKKSKLEYEDIQRLARDADQPTYLLKDQIQGELNQSPGSPPAKK